MTTPSSSGKRLKRSKKYLQPPTLSNYLYNSENTNGEQIQQMHELSNVQEKSYFSSENNQNENHEIQQMLNTISPNRTPSQQSNQNDEELPNYEPSLSPKRSINRLEQQAIIAVEEQFQLDSDADKGNESVILEHIDFQENQLNTEKKLTQNAHEAEESGKEAYESEQVDYVINFMEPQEFGWEKEDNQSNSHPQDMIFDQLKVTNSRQSKNTFRERMSQQVVSQNLDNKNRSCLVRRYSSKQSLPAGSMNSEHSRNSLNDILNKWKSYKDSNKEDEEKEAQRDDQNHTLQRMEVEVQTIECQFNYESLLKNLQFTEDEWRKSQAQNIKLIEKQRNNESELAQLRYLVKNLESKCQRTQEQKQTVFQKNMKLQMCVRDQNETIREYEEKNLLLSKQLEKTIRFTETRELNGSSSSNFLSPKMHKLQTFGHPINMQDSMDHHECLEKIETLQEKIFDLEQKSVGIDIEVDRRVKIICQQLEFDLKRNLALEYQDTIRVLQEQLKAIEQRYNIVESEKKSMSDRLRFKQKELIEREDTVKRMYEELVNEWRQVDRNKQRFRSSSSHYSPLLPSVSSPKSVRQPYNGKLETSLVRRQYNYRQNDNYQPSRDFNLPASSATAYRQHSNQSDQLSSVNYFNSRFSGAQSFSYKFGPQLSVTSDKNRPSFQAQPFFRKTSQNQFENGDNLELQSINSKIHKLREEINRQLTFIN